MAVDRSTSLSHEVKQSSRYGFDDAAAIQGCQLASAFHGGSCGSGSLPEDCEYCTSRGRTRGALSSKSSFVLSIRLSSYFARIRQILVRKHGASWLKSASFVCPESAIVWSHVHSD